MIVEPVRLPICARWPSPALRYVGGGTGQPCSRMRQGGTPCALRPPSSRPREPNPVRVIALPDRGVEPPDRKVCRRGKSQSRDSSLDRRCGDRLTTPACTLGPTHPVVGKDAGCADSASSRRLAQGRVASLEMVQAGSPIKLRSEDRMQDYRHHSSTRRRSPAEVRELAERPREPRHRVFVSDTRVPLVQCASSPLVSSAPMRCVCSLADRTRTRCRCDAARVRRRLSTGMCWMPMSLGTSDHCYHAHDGIPLMRRCVRGGQLSVGRDLRRWLRPSTCRPSTRPVSQPATPPSQLELRARWRFALVRRTERIPAAVA